MSRRDNVEVAINETARCRQGMRQTGESRNSGHVQANHRVGNGAQAVGTPFLHMYVRFAHVCGRTALFVAALNHAANLARPRQPLNIVRLTVCYIAPCPPNDVWFSAHIVQGGCPAKCARAQNEPGAGRAL